MHVKPLDEGHGDYECAAGYLFKDRNMPGWEWRSHNMTDEHISTCIETYDRHTHGYEVGKTTLGKGNWMKKVYGWWSKHYCPIPVHWLTILKHMVQQVCVSRRARRAAWPPPPPPSAPQIFPGYTFFRTGCTPPTALVAVGCAALPSLLCRSSLRLAPSPRTTATASSSTAPRLCSTSSPSPRRAPRSISSPA